MDPLQDIPTGCQTNPTMAGPRTVPRTPGDGPRTHSGMITSATACSHISVRHKVYNYNILIIISNLILLMGYCICTGKYLFSSWLQTYSHTPVFSNANTITLLFAYSHSSGMRSTTVWKSFSRTLSRAFRPSTSVFIRRKLNSVCPLCPPGKLAQTRATGIKSVLTDYVT